ncbi:GDP-mannose transporter into the lumen of the Golgi [Blyttiomyces sp. JEL0837]|nr:GDP-mannose transporter into the lumen of the Golgi [Blyttiomyces sp. JEL0837]
MTEKPTIYNGPVAAILAYCGASILMTVTNKVILSSYAFHMNFLVLAIQSTVCIIILEICAKFGLLSHRPFKVEEAKRWFPVSLALVVMIYTGSKALQYLSIPLFTIFKNLTIIMIAYGEVLFYNGAPVTRLILVSFLLMVLSSVIAGWADISAGKVLKDGAKQSGILIPYLWMMANCFSTAFYPLGMRSKIREVNFKDYDTVFYNNLLSIPILIVSSFLFEGKEFAKAKERFIDPGYDSEQFNGLVFAIIISSVSTFAISFGTSWCVRVTSSTTYSMVGALNKLPIAVAGMMFFDDPVTFGGVSGVLIAFGAGVLYVYAKNQGNKMPTPSRGGHLPLPVTESDRDKHGLIIRDAMEENDRIK